MAGIEALKTRISKIEAGNADNIGFTCVLIGGVYPDTTVPPTEEIFSTPEAAKAAAVLREAGRPVPEDRVICLQAVDFKRGAPHPCGWTVGTL